MEADLGESEIIEPLQAVLKLPTIDGYLRHHWRRGKSNQNSSVKLFYIYLIHQIIQVSNKDDVIPLVQQLAGKARVFALGI